MLDSVAAKVLLVVPCVILLLSMKEVNGVYPERYLYAFFLNLINFGVGFRTYLGEGI